jgi:hypothetical protein
MDIRLMRASDKLPAIGSVTAVDEKAITVTGKDGKTERFLFDEKTYCRSYGGIKPAALNDIPKLAGVGAKVIVSSERGVARLIRPQR